MIDVKIGQRFRGVCSETISKGIVEIKDFVDENFIDPVMDLARDKITMDPNVLLPIRPEDLLNNKYFKYLTGQEKEL